MPDKAMSIERYLKRLGRSVRLFFGDTQETVFAVIEPTWKRNKSRFEKNASEIGRYHNGYYIYYGPASCDIRRLGEEDYAEMDGERYYFIQAESVKVSDRVQYYRGVLKKETKGAAAEDE